MKGKLGTAWIVVAGCALSAGSASAGELFSARLGAQDGQTLSCTAVNVGRKEVRLNVDLFETGEYDGTPGAQGSSFPPGGSSGSSTAGPISAFCRVTYSGNKKNVRASIQVTQDNSVVSVLPVQ
jgi:hypothetical protein